MKFIIFFLFFSTIFFSSYSKDCLCLSVIDSQIINKVSQVILEKAYSKIDINMSYCILSPKRAIAESNLGTIDGQLHRIKGLDSEFKNIVMIPIAINYVHMVAFYKNETININTENDLKPYLLGIKKDIISLEHYDKLYQVSYAESDCLNFKKLNADRLDIVIAPYIVGKSLIKKLNLENIKYSNEPLIIVPLYHYINKKNMHLYDNLYKILKEMEENGEIKKIRNNIISNLDFKI